MPIYEYECSACKHRFERSQRFSDAALTECPDCGGSVRRVIFPAGVVFKGSGWYITDSRKSSEPASSTPSDASAGDKSDSSATKTETKSDGATAASGASGASGSGNSGGSGTSESSSAKSKSKSESSSSSSAGKKS